MNTHVTVGIQLHAFLTSTLDGCKGSTSHQAGLPHRKKYQVPTEYEAGKAMKPVWILWRKEKSLVPVKNPITIPKLSKIYPSHYGDIIILTQITYTFHHLTWSFSFPRHLVHVSWSQWHWMLMLHATNYVSNETFINLKIISWLPLCVLLSKMLHIDRIWTHI